MSRLTKQDGDMERSRRAFSEAVERMHAREAAEQIAEYWRQDHLAGPEPEVFCPVALKWISRAAWEEECRKEQLGAAGTAGGNAENGREGRRCPPRLGSGLEIEFVR